MVVFYLQLALAIALFFFKVKLRKHFIIYLPIMVGVSIGALLLIEHFLPMDRTWSNYIYYSIPYILAMIVSLVSFDVPIYKNLFLLIAAFIVQNFAHHICQLVFETYIYFSNNEAPPAFGWMTFVTYFISYLIVYTVTYFLMIRKGYIYSVKFIKSKYVIMLFFWFFLIMIVYGIYMRHVHLSTNAKDPFFIFYELYSVGMGIFYIGTLVAVFKSEKTKNDVSELEFRLQQEAKYYEMSKANIEQINIKCHDLKHQIMALKSNEDSEEKQEAISDISEAVLLYEDFAKTGNDALDAILTEKSMFCRSNHINFTYMVDGAKLDFMNKLDIYSLFGNALDNAIEYVQKLDDDNKKIISLKVFEKGGYINILLENYCEDVIVMKDGIPQTTKKDKTYHGFGIQSMKYIVGKYKGNLLINISDKVFSLDISLLASEQSIQVQPCQK